jgi:hypothetical protein
LPRAIDGASSVLSPKLAAQKMPRIDAIHCRESSPGVHLAVVRFASGADFDIFAMHGPADAVGDLATNLGLRTLAIGRWRQKTRLHTHTRLGKIQLESVSACALKRLECSKRLTH